MRSSSDRNREIWEVKFATIAPAAIVPLKSQRFLSNRASLSQIVIMIRFSTNRLGKTLSSSNSAKDNGFNPNPSKKL
jgi:hypothetical protein